MTIDLNALGITPADLEDKIIEAAVSRLLDSEEAYEDRIYRGVQREFQERLNAAVQEIGDEKVAPLVREMADNLTLQATNEWGEKTKGDPITFTEYMVQRAEAYMQETVNYDGKKPDYHSRGTQSRITYIVNSHLQYSISIAVKDALNDLNSKLAQGIAETVKIQLANALDKLKIDVKS